MITVREAAEGDVDAILSIYNEGIEDRVATLDLERKSRADIEAWWRDRDGRYCVLVAAVGDNVVGYAALNRHSPRRAHDAIADLSVYVARRFRGQGAGRALLRELERRAIQGGFHKIVLFALNGNEPGKALYRGAGFREIGVLEEHGRIDGELVDVVAMEKILGRPYNAS